MPRVPDIPLASVPRQAGVPQVAQPRVAGEAARALGQAAQVVFEFGSRMQSARRAHDVEERYGEFSVQMSSAIQEALANPDARQILPQFESQLEQLEANALAGVDDPIAQAELSRRIGQIAGSSRISLAREGFKRERDDSISAMGRTLQSHVDAIAADPGSDFIYETRLQAGIDSISANQFIRDEDREGILRKYKAQAQTARVKSHFNRGLQAGGSAGKVEIARANALLADRAATDALTEDERFTLQKSAEVLENARDVQSRRDALDRRENALDATLERILTAKSAADLPTIDEIATDPDLKAGTKIRLSSIIEADAKGFQVASDIRLKNEVQLRIWAGIITTTEEVDQYLAQGLSVKDTAEFRKQVVKQQRGDVKPVDKQFQRTLADMHKIITGRNEFTTNPFEENDVELALRANDYFLFATDVWEAAKAQNMNPRELRSLLDEIQEMALKFKKTPRDEMRRQARALGEFVPPELPPTQPVLIPSMASQPGTIPGDELSVPPFTAESERERFDELENLLKEAGQ